MGISTGLISYWKLNETASTGYDSVGVNNLSGNVSTNRPGIIGAGLEFHGVAKGYNFTSSPTASASELSISMWVYPTSLATESILWYEGYTASGQFYVSTVDFETRDVGTGTGGARNNDLGTPGLVLKQWNHLVVVYSVVNGYKRMYRNANNPSENTTSVERLTSERTLSTCAIGYDSLDPLYCNARIDEVGIWNRALTIDEIRTLYNGGDGLSYPFNIVSHTPVNYYVKTGGCDGSTGLSNVQAWAHHPWMDTWEGTTTLGPGDTVYMNRGNTWTIASPTSYYINVSQRGASGNFITTTAYGAGEKPKINISTATNFDVIYADGRSYIKFDNLDITHNSSTYNAARRGIFFTDDASTCHDWTITNCNIHSIGATGIYGKGNCYNITIGDENATSTATEDSYSNNIYDCGYAGIELAGCNPVTLESNFKIYHNYIHNIDTDGLQVDSYGVAMSCTGNSVGWPKYCYVRYNRIKNIPKWEGIDTHGGEYYYVQDNYVYKCRLPIAIAAADLENYPATILNHVWIERNEIVQPGAGAFGYTKALSVSSQLDSSRAKDVYIRDNNCYWVTQQVEDGHMGIQIFRINDVIIDGNRFSNGPLGNSLGAIYLDTAAVGYGCNNVIIRNNWIDEWVTGIRMRNEGIDGNVEIYNNIIHSSYDDDADYVARGLIYLASSGDSSLRAGAHIQIYNNTLLRTCDVSGSIVLGFGDDVNVAHDASITVKNNIVGYTASVASGIYSTRPRIEKTSGSVIVNNNLYWNSTRPTPFMMDWDGSNFSLTTWKAIGHDASSPNVTATLNPKFKNAGGSYAIDTDVKLQSDSSAIGRGADIPNINNDYGNRPYASSPAIGAYEFIPTNKYYVSYFTDPTTRRALRYVNRIRVKYIAQGD